MILVTVHTYNGCSDTDETQLLGVYSNLAKAKAAVYELMKYYTNQYLTNCNVFPGHIEDQDSPGPESKIENVKTLFPYSYEQVENILKPTYSSVDIDCTYTIDIDDRAFDFKKPTYNTDLPTIYLGGSKSIKED